jgi:hypothetical protein
LCVVERSDVDISRVSIEEIVGAAGAAAAARLDKEEGIEGGYFFNTVTEQVRAWW